MYTHNIYRFKNSIEHEYKYAGNYGAKGEKRDRRKKATPDQIRKQNQINRENRTRRTMKLNWKTKDLWCCFKYPKGLRPTVDEVLSDRRELLKRLRAAYKSRNIPLKYYSRLEIGAEGGVHFHMLINRIWGAQTDVILTTAWEETLRKHNRCKRTEGLVDYKTVYDSGGMKDLSAYMVKEPEEGSKEYEQLSFFNESDKKKLLSITSSKNLIRPEPEHHVYKHWTMRKLLENGPKQTPGFYIEKESLYQGINPYTGMSYLKYTEVRIKTEGRASPEGEWM